MAKTNSEDSALLEKQQFMYAFNQLENGQNQVRINDDFYVEKEVITNHSASLHEKGNQFTYAAAETITTRAYYYIKNNTGKKFVTLEAITKFFYSWNKIQILSADGVGKGLSAGYTARCTVQKRKNITKRIMAGQR